jgi:dipeptidyl aminopeptidase/acylaminoacyl peptidase
MFLGPVNKHIKKMAKLDINRVAPIEFVHKLKTPVFFIGGTEDVVCPLSM